MTAFIAAMPVTGRPSPTRALSSAPPATRARRPARVHMSTAAAGEPVKKSEDTGYVIRQSEFVDPSAGEQDDDMGDGFIGEAEMDDCLGVSMPEDLANFEMKEIQNSRTRDELVNKLKDIKERRRDILDDRRKGLGMDNVGNYLDAL